MSESSAGETVVLIHGLWMTPRSWENWLERFEARRATSVLAPSWPGLEEDVEAIREDPSPLRGLGVDGDRRPLRADHPRARPAADHHRPLVRRA